MNSRPERAREVKKKVLGRSLLGRASPPLHRQKLSFSDPCEPRRWLFEAPIFAATENSTSIKRIRVKNMRGRERHGDRERERLEKQRVEDMGYRKKGLRKKIIKE